MTRTSLITGVNGHIARRLAAARIQLGERVIGIDLGKDCVVEGVRYISCDLSDADALMKSCLEIASIGEIDHFVHCAAMTANSAGRGWTGSLPGQSVDLWNRALAVNLTSAFIISKELFSLPSSLSDRRIVLLSSIYGALGPDKLIYEGQTMANAAAYGVSKAGLEALGRYLASMLSPAVKVNTIRLGGIERGQREAFIGAYNRKTLLGRMGTESDVLPVVSFLLEPGNSYMTGSVVDVDGGLSVI